MVLISQHACLFTFSGLSFSLAYLTRVEKQMTPSSLPERRYQRRVEYNQYPKVTRPSAPLEHRITALRTNKRR